MLQSSSSEKNLVKPLKIAIFGSNLHKKGLAWSTPKMKNNFLAEITKADHQLSETFYFIKKSSILANLWIFFYFVVRFFIKKGSFPYKTVVYRSLFMPESVSRQFKSLLLQLVPIRPRGQLEVIKTLIPLVYRLPCFGNCHFIKTWEETLWKWEFWQEKENDC